MPKFGPKLLPEILKLSQNFSLAESSRMTPAFVHNLLPETDNCLSWISGRERMTVENISWSISMEECCQTWRGLNPRPPYLQSDAKPTEPPRPGNGWCIRHQLTILSVSSLFLPSPAGHGGSVGCQSDWWSGDCSFDPWQLPGQQHERSDYEIFSTGILSLLLIQERQLSTSGERMCTMLVNSLED